jgi:fatty-acyl-CoA synthase
MFNQSWIGNYSYFRARITPDKEAIFDLDNSKGYTYADLERRANILANYMTKKILLKKGDRVAFISRNRIELFDAYYGTGKAGLIFVPYNARLSAEELVSLIKNEEPRILFYENIFLDTVNKIKENTNVEFYVSLDDIDDALDFKDISYSSLMSYDDVSSALCPELSLEDTHLIIHTGGTTGLPKGAELSHRAVLFNSMNEIITWGISHSDSAHLLLPLFHTGGWNLLTLPLLHAGGRVLINKQFEPKQALEVINKEKPTFIFGAATIFRMMISFPEFEATDFSSVKWVMAGAAPTPLNIMEKFWEKKVPFVLGYGMTEAGPNNLTAPAEFMDFEKMRSKHASVGKPMYFTMAKIVDDFGNEVRQGEVGELIWSGPQIFSGYWKNIEETEKTLKNGWVYTGDMAMEDEEGYYYIVGRKKNMFISGGENVFPPEIEKAIYEFDEIHEACVIGVPDPVWGEVGKAVVSLKEGKLIDRDKIISQLKNKLAHYKVPKYIQIIDELPKNNVGKIVMAKVIEEYGNASNE